jgi:hypothetical protein
LLVDATERSFYHLMEAAREPGGAQLAAAPTFPTSRPGRFKSDAVGTSGPMKKSPLSIASRGSILSLGSEGSILSVGSAGSILSVGSVGSIGSAFSVGSAGSVASLLSAGSLGSVLSAGKRRAILGRPATRATMAPIAGALALAAAGLVFARG